MIPETVTARLDRQPGDGCWVWTGAVNDKGYPQVRINMRLHYVHRLMYELAVGVIPDGFDVHHECRNRRCVRPDHLTAMSKREHGLTRSGETCGRGHPFTEDNTYTRPDNGSRQCRACRRERTGSRPNTGTCLVCGASLAHKRSTAKYCSPTHNAMWHKRMARQKGGDAL